MAINKPNIPDAELPEDWGGTQYPYTEEQIENGLPEAVPTVIDGGNLNYEKRGLFQNIKYLRVFSDWLRSIPIGKIPVINSNGQLDYEIPVVDSTVVHNTGNETVGGVKTFSSQPVLSYAQANSVAIIGANKELTHTTAVTSTELGYLDGVTSSIQNQLNGKANTSVSNLNSTGKQNIVTLGMPDYSAGVAINNRTDFTCPKDGLVIAYGASSKQYRSWVKVNGVDFILSTYWSDVATPTNFVFPVEKGSILHFDFTYAASATGINFYPYKGAN